VCKGFGALATSVPCHGTEVYFPTAKPVSSVIREQFSGGGLFGRPATRKSPGRS